MVAVARMSEATSGKHSATGPGYRFAHPGYEPPFFASKGRKLPRENPLASIYPTG
jgi:hypothetical protein